MASLLRTTPTSMQLFLLLILPLVTLCTATSPYEALAADILSDFASKQPNGKR